MFIFLYLYYKLYYKYKHPLYVIVLQAFVNLTFLTARRYVRLSVRHKSVFYRNGKTADQYYFIVGCSCRPLCLFLGRLYDGVDLTKPVSTLKCPSVRAYVHTVRTYIRPSTKRFFDFNEIWHTGRGRWVMHDAMQYDPIRGQGQGNELFKVGNLDVFKSYLFGHFNGSWQVATWPLILKIRHNI